MPTKSAKTSSQRDRLRDHVEQTVAVLDQHKTSSEPEGIKIESPEVRAALRRNRQYGDLPLAAIEPDPTQVRRVDVRGERFQELVASVREHGVLEPITVRWIEDKKTFQVVTGERRFRAAQKAGLEYIPAIVRDVTDTKKAIHQLVENLQREDMNPIDEAKAFRRYLAAAGVTQAELARQVGKSETYVSRMMGLLEHLTTQEQQDLAGLAPAQLPGKSLILEALRVDDPKIRRAILFGQLTRQEARKAVRKDKPAGRPKNARKVFSISRAAATVTVRFRKPSASPLEVWEVLTEATAQQKSALEHAGPADLVKGG